MTRKKATVDSVRDEMRALADTKAAKYELEIVEHFPLLSKLNPGSYIGTFSYSDVTAKRRWVKKEAVVDVGFGVQTMTDVARDWCKARFGRLRAPMDAIRKCSIERAAPIYCVPQSFNHGYYLDLKSAYWQVVKAVGYDLEYEPGVYLIPGQAIVDFPLPDHKIARSSIVTGGHTSLIQMWTGSRVLLKQHGGTNNLLWAYVMDILNGIATEAIEAGAVYAYTDGYIVDHTHLSAVRAVLDSWQVAYGLKAMGDTWIAGVNQYRVGDRETKVFNPFNDDEPFVSLYNYVPRDWLKWTFTKAIEIRRRHNRENAFSYDPGLIP